LCCYLSGSSPLDRDDAHVAAEIFLKDMRAAGVRITTTTEVFTNPAIGVCAPPADPFSNRGERRAKVRPRDVSDMIGELQVQMKEVMSLLCGRMSLPCDDLGFELRNEFNMHLDLDVDVDDHHDDDGDGDDDQNHSDVGDGHGLDPCVEAPDDEEREEWEEEVSDAHGRHDAGTVAEKCTFTSITGSFALETTNEDEEV
jgi:hypothetical protein